MDRDDLRTMSIDPHLRKHPEVLRRLVYALREDHDQMMGLEREIDRLERGIRIRDHLLENSCHKRIGGILLDKIRYRVRRWTNTAPQAPMSDRKPRERVG